MSVLDSLRCGVTFGGSGCSATWLTRTFSGLVIAIGLILILVAGAIFVGRYQKSHPAGSRRRRDAAGKRRPQDKPPQVAPTEERAVPLTSTGEHPFPLAVLDAHGVMARLSPEKRPSSFTGLVHPPHRPRDLRPLSVYSNLLAAGEPAAHGDTRVLAPAVALRKGPTVVVSGDAKLARLLAPVVDAQRSSALWWEPAGTLPVPPGTTPVRWDVLAQVNDAPTSTALARDLVRAASFVTDGSGHGPIPERAITAVAGSLLGARYGRGSARAASRWIAGDPEDWDDAVRILDLSVDRSAWALAGDLDVSRRTASEWLHRREREVLAVVAGALEILEPTSSGPTRALFPRSFAGGAADVLFVPVPRERGASHAVAAAVLLRRLVALHERAARHSFLRPATPPLSVVVDEPTETIALPDLPDLLVARLRTGVNWTAATTRPRALEAHWPGHPLHGPDQGWPARLSLSPTFGGDDEGWLVTPAGEHLGVVLPDFDERPWSDVTEAATRSARTVAETTARGTAPAPSTTPSGQPRRIGLPPRNPAAPRRIGLPARDATGQGTPHTGPRPARRGPSPLVRSGRRPAPSGYGKARSRGRLAR